MDYWITTQHTCICRICNWYSFGKYWVPQRRWYWAEYSSWCSIHGQPWWIKYREPATILTQTNTEVEIKPQTLYCRIYILEVRLTSTRGEIVGPLQRQNHL
ncbi:hypothetical protein PPTG_15307 [Phytophthora nicotianae INRA-310]|uniref:Uncharacterized protein n=1 Tax=Phytophthora nicotianae (strain INRA-310) TaxID=761204 RepID=W2PU26_PHYN3|nr:hypothetical protein PPTG_15307 [Phytophthora nicotianae INRA-310]ETN04131.1 hypothetical protein PPTG_15307 [Phytophthora nicotianae INRA-310]